MASSSVAMLDSIDGTDLSEQERLDTLKAANRLIKRLEKPVETLLHPYSTFITVAILQTFEDLRLFDKWAEAGLDKPMTIDALSTMTGCDAEFLARMLRHLVSVDFLTLVDANTFQTTPHSAVLVEPGYRDLIPWLIEVPVPAMLQIPKFLQKKNYTNVINPEDYPMLDSKGYGVFEAMKRSPEVARLFNQVIMISNEKNSIPWVDLYPLDEVLSAEGVLVVDVGGNQGGDLKRLANKHKLPDGSLILQDLPAGLANAELPNSITPMEHDFFNPQPVKGAKIYYLHRTLHNWPESDVLKILRNLRDAMKLGHSKILIHEVVVFTKSPWWFSTWQDLMMFALFAGGERTDLAWDRIAGKVGLKVAQVYSSPLDTIFELVLAEESTNIASS